VGFTSANPIVALLGYLDFLHLMSEARVVFTDSGGIQEKTTILGVSSITLQETTERLITVEHGTNILVASSPERIFGEFTRASRDARKLAGSSHYWDGNAAKRIIKCWLMTFPRSDQGLH
jgi:UDP-N-acetylglucosamine 2-epimerase (non-hydrolysing)